MFFLFRTPLAVALTVALGAGTAHAEAFEFRGAVRGLKVLAPTGVDSGTPTVPAPVPTPPPGQSLSAQKLTFPGTQVGRTSAEQQVLFANTSAGALSLEAVTSAAPFDATHNCAPHMASGYGCVAAVTFTPTSVGPASGSLAFSTASGVSTVVLEGTGLGALLSYQTPEGTSLSTVVFPDTSAGAQSPEQRVIVKNTGNQDLVFTGTAFTVAAPFKITSDTCSAATLAPDATCLVHLTFSPALSQQYVYSATLVSNSNAVAPNDLVVRGTGTPAGVLQVVTGGYSTYIQRTDGTWAAAGSNNFGQLGLGDTTSRTRFEPIPGSSNITKIVAGSNFAFARRSDGTWSGVGGNTLGQLGIGNTNNKTTFTPVPLLVGATEVIAGSSHAFAKLASGRWAATGYNYNGQLGLYHNSNVSSFTVVSALDSAVQVVAGGYHTAALLTTGDVIATGEGSAGALGTGGDARYNRFTATYGVSNVIALAAGETSTFAKTGNDRWYVTGSGATGTDVRKTFGEVPALQGALRVIAGAHTFAALPGGSWLAAGKNTYGQLGLGDTTARSTFVPVPALAGVSVVVTRGAQNTFALFPGTGVEAVGQNGMGELGLGDTAPRLQFTLVSP